MSIQLKKHLFDIQEAVDPIFDYLGDKRDFNLYRNNKQLRRAVEREFEVIGEATNRILKEQPDFPIKNARKIVDLRNWVIHAYDSVDNIIIWGIIVKDLPELKTEVDNSLSSGIV